MRNGQHCFRFYISFDINAMSVIPFFFFLLLLFSLIPLDFNYFSIGYAQASTPFSSLSLTQAFDLGIKNNESPQIQRSRTLQVQEKINQAQSAILPRVNLAGTYTRQGLPERSRDSERDKYAHNLRVNVTQPLFHGFREFYAINIAKYDLQAQKEMEEQNRLNLYSQITQYFYSILTTQADLDNLDEQLSITNARIKELRDRVGIGKSRKADLLMAESQKSSILAQVDAVKNQLLLQKENFAFSLGIDKEDNKEGSGEDLNNLNLKDTITDLPEFGKMENLLQKIENRPDIRALVSQVNASDEQIASVRSARFPGIDLAGNYYFDRSGSPRPSMWDVGLTLSLPLFDGGVISSQIAESVERKTERNLLLLQARRTAEKDIRILYETWAGNKSQLEAVEKSIKSAEQAYKEQLRDYRFGLATLLDVLQTQNGLLDAKKKS